MGHLPPHPHPVPVAAHVPAVPLREPEQQIKVGLLHALPVGFPHPEGVAVGFQVVAVEQPGHRLGGGHVLEGALVPPPVEAVERGRGGDGEAGGAELRQGELAGGDLAAEDLAGVVLVAHVDGEAGEEGEVGGALAAEVLAVEGQGAAADPVEQVEHPRGAEGPVPGGAEAHPVRVDDADRDQALVFGHIRRLLGYGSTPAGDWQQRNNKKRWSFSMSFLGYTYVSIKGF